QVRDYLGLVGDSSDNIPGVPSIGPKTASELLKAHGSLLGILEAAQAGQIAGKKGEVLKTHKDDAILSAKLATVHEELDVKVNLADFKYHFHVTPECVDFLKKMDFHSLVARWLNEPGKIALAKAAQATPARSPEPDERG